MVIAKILKPQGIRGELKIRPMIEEENFLKLKKVQIDNQIFNIKKASCREGFVFISFEEIKDRNMAETFRDKEICAEKDELLPLDENFYYVDDLIGCEIFFEDGEKVGKVLDVYNFGAGDILTIKDGSEEVMCPFLNKVFPEVLIKEKKILANRKSFLEVTQSEN